MTVFDLLFIVVFLLSVATLLAVIVFALLRRFTPATRLFALYIVCFAFYLGVVVAVSLTSPQRILALGENRCFDDWCIAVDDAIRSEPPMQVVYTVTLRMSNRARRIAQRENGIAIYVIDEKGQRFESIVDSSAVPFNTLLQPDQSVTTTRIFQVVGSSGKLSLVVGHDGSSTFPGVLIIGDDSSLFHKPTIVRLP